MNIFQIKRLLENYRQLEKIDRYDPVVMCSLLADALEEVLEWINQRIQQRGQLK